MTALALVDALPDFGPRFAPRAAAPSVVAPVAVQSEPAIDIEKLVAAEIAQAEAALAERLQALHNAEIEALETAHHDQAEQLAHQLGAQAAAAIARAFDDAERRLLSHLDAAASRVLSAFLGDELQKRAVDALARTVAATLADRDAVRVRVSGPLHLSEPLANALGARAAQMEFTEAPGLDLAVDIDGNLIETRLSEWSAAIAETLA